MHAWTEPDVPSTLGTHAIPFTMHGLDGLSFRWLTSAMSSFSNILTVGRPSFVNTRWVASRRQPSIGVVNP
uniref:Uncharacterized protein n=1 Tax=Cannabis sativa TaxID=3483 RepID=A0A803QBL5_CANSA